MCVSQKLADGGFQWLLQHATMFHATENYKSTELRVRQDRALLIRGKMVSVGAPRMAYKCVREATAVPKALKVLEPRRIQKDPAISQL